jgi:hypothetical protein
MLERLLRSRGLHAVHVLCPAEQLPRVRQLADGLDVAFEAVSAPPTAYAALVRAGRWWGLDGWRGGIGGLCAFDEDIDLHVLTEVARRTAADAVVSLPAAAPLVDPALVDDMLRHYEANAELTRMTFVQAPPGLAGVVLGRQLLEEWTPTNQPPGLLLAYHPDRPIPDLTGREACYRPPAVVIEARGRLICDTRRSLERVRDLLDAGAEEWDAQRICTWLAGRAESFVEPFPREIEVELTTADPLPDSLLRPRGPAVGPRGPLSMEAVEALAAAAAEWDDTRIVLAGFGEPTAHPRFEEICRRLRPAAAALAVRTSAVEVPTAAAAALFETPVDVVEVSLDAVTPETYRQVHGRDAFAQASATLEAWLERRLGSGQVLPLIVPGMVKARENFAEMEPFFETWQRRLGCVLLTGYSHCAGQRPARAVMPTAPPHRVPCRRVFGRAVVLADGRLTTCDQDYRGVQALGDIRRTPLEELWRSAGLLAAIRGDASAAAPLCPACEEWHRP